MQPTLCLVGKRSGRPPIVASAAGHNKGLFFLCDDNSRQQFLVDTGAEISVLPATRIDPRTRLPGPELLAANGTTIQTYGTRTLTLNFASKTYQ